MELTKLRETLKQGEDWGEQLRPIGFETAYLLLDVAQASLDFVQAAHEDERQEALTRLEDALVVLSDAPA